MRMGAFLVLLAVAPTLATWNDIVDKFNKVKDVLTKANTPKIAEDSGRFLESFNLTDVNKVREGLQMLREKTRAKINQSVNKVNRKILQSVQQTDDNKTRQRIREEGDNIRQANEKHNHSDSLYQLDMVLTTSQLDKILEDIDNNKRARRQAYKDRWYPRTIWPNNLVYYYYDRNIGTDARSAIEKAIQFWSKNTCIDFQENRAAANKIRFFVGEGCYSYVGYIGQGTQDISIGRGCESMGTAAHEIGHALGFFHTQSRYDRDDFITVSTQNIARDYVDQFDKETTTTNNNYGMTYDWGSIMQYGAASASANGKATMFAKNTNYQDTMGSDIVAFYDVSMMNEHYKCKEKCPSASSAKCQNGGYPHPRNCATCICPRGFGGTTCTVRPDGCGSILNATATAQTFSSTTGNKETGVLLDFDECAYLIIAPAGKRIEATISSLESRSCTDGCVYGGLEIKADPDYKLTGYRYCCSRADIGTVVTSSTNVLPIIGFNRYGSTTFTITYKFVDGGATGPVLDVLNNGKEPENSGVVTSPPSSPAPQTTTSTRAPIPPTTQNCFDNRNCAAWVFYFDFCRTYPPVFQKVYCPRRCGYC